MSYTSYYLYQKYQSINGSTPAPVYPMEYSYDGEGTMPTVVKSYSDVTCGYAPPSPPSPTDYSRRYLTIESLEDGNTIKWKNGSGNFSNTISASTDNGTTWAEYTATTGGTSIATLNTGDKVLLKGLNERYFPVNSGTYGFQDGNGFVASKNFIVYGNIMSLVSGDTFDGATTVSSWAFSNIFYQSNKLISAEHLVLPATILTEHCYQDMFIYCSSLTTAPSTLPATTLTDYCYRNMFFGCTSLTTAPELPATTLADSCYNDMFSNCTSLTTAPALPATTLVRYCYAYMFRRCTSLTVAPELPATTLATECYQDMFNGCTSLTTAPELPATTLAEYCYQAMFLGCTSLTTAPELPATTLADYCYYYMFNGCTNLNYIKCLATDANSSDCGNWVNGVAATGTFVKNPLATNWGTGTSGIPNNWTVQNV